MRELKSRCGLRRFEHADPHAQHNVVCLARRVHDRADRRPSPRAGRSAAYLRMSLRRGWWARVSCYKRRDRRGPGSVRILLKKSAHPFFEISWRRALFHRHGSQRLLRDLPGRRCRGKGAGWRPASRSALGMTLPAPCSASFSSKRLTNCREVMAFEFDTSRHFSRKSLSSLEAPLISSRLRRASLPFLLTSTRSESRSRRSMSARRRPKSMTSKSSPERLLIHIVDWSDKSSARC